MSLFTGIKIKRLNKKRECVTTLEEKCSCCQNDAIVQLIFKKQNDKNEKKTEKSINLCEEHLKIIKEYLFYF